MNITIFSCGISFNTGIFFFSYNTACRCNNIIIIYIYTPWNISNEILLVLVAFNTSWICISHCRPIVLSVVNISILPLYENPHDRTAVLVSRLTCSLPKTQEFSIEDWFTQKQCLLQARPVIFKINKSKF